MRSESTVQTRAAGWVKNGCVWLNSYWLSNCKGSSTLLMQSGIETQWDRAAYKWVSSACCSLDASGSQNTWRCTVQIFSASTQLSLKKKSFCTYEPAESHFGSNYTVPLSRVGAEWQLGRKMSLRQSTSLRSGGVLWSHYVQYIQLPQSLQPRPGSLSHPVHITVWEVWPHVSGKKSLLQRFKCIDSCSLRVFKALA